MAAIKSPSAGPAPSQPQPDPSKFASEKSMACSFTRQLASERSTACSLTRSFPGQLSSERSTAHSATRSFQEDYQATDEVLGVGMTGEVGVAVHKSTGAKVAVKTFKIDELSEMQLGDMLREIKIQSSVRHPNLARVHGCYESEGRVQLVIEHLDGGSGAERLKRGFSEAQAAAVVAQVLEAAEHLHANGIVHRDIKLDNVMFEDRASDKVRLIDFGLACRWKQGARPLTRSCGTPYYMAPEVLKGSYTSQADLWSIGVMAHEMLTNEWPKLDVWSMQPVLSDRLESCSPEAKSLVCGLLTEASSRMTASEALRHSWFQSKDLESQDQGRPSWWRNVFSSTTNTIQGALGRMRRRSRIAPLSEFTEVVPGHTATLLS